MGAANWTVDSTCKPGIVMLRLSGTFSEGEMRAFVAAHNTAIDDLHGSDYKVFCDIRDLTPLSPEVAETFEHAKRHSSRQKNFRGSAVLTTSAVVALQHRRTSITSGVMNTELISDDERACWEHLKNVYRGSSARDDSDST